MWGAIRQPSPSRSSSSNANAVRHRTSVYPGSVPRREARVAESIPGWAVISSQAPTSRATSIRFVTW